MTQGDWERFRFRCQMFLEEAEKLRRVMPAIQADNDVKRKWLDDTWPLFLDLRRRHRALMDYFREQGYVLPEEGDAPTKEGEQEPD